MSSDDAVTGLLSAPRTTMPYSVSMPQTFRIAMTRTLLPPGPTAAATTSRILVVLLAAVLAAHRRNVDGVMHLSVLDLSVVREGGTSGEALHDTTELARAADRLGFVRFWIAEHHNMATVASTSPSVLIAHLAASTERI